MERLYKRYVDIDEAFKAIVDRAPNARVDTEVMKKDKRDFCVYSDATTDDSHFIENYAEEIKKRFEKYLEGEKGVRVPDYKPARRSLEELCGDGGQIDKSIKKCFEFDDEALSAINRSGLEEQIYDLTEDITNTARVLDGFKVFSPDVAKTSVSLLSLNNVKAITAFNALNPNRDNNAEVIQLAKLLNIKCSLNTVVDTDTINTAAELMMLNCKTDQEKVDVQLCAASMIGAPADAKTLYDLMGLLKNLWESLGPYGAVFGLALLVVIVANFIASHADDIERFVNPKAKEDDGVLIEVPPEQDQKRVFEGPISRPRKEPSITDIPSGEVKEKSLEPGEVFRKREDEEKKILQKKAGNEDIPPDELDMQDSKQIGKKWGKHKEDYPEMEDSEEYKEYAQEVHDNPDRIIHDEENGEYIYQKGEDILRVTEEGEFISLYPGAESSLVEKAIERGGLIWEK